MQRAISSSKWAGMAPPCLAWFGDVASMMDAELRKCAWIWSENGGQGVNRTLDTRIFSPLLYRLSYLPTEILKRSPSLLAFREMGCNYADDFVAEIADCFRDSLAQRPDSRLHKIDHPAFQIGIIQPIDLLDPGGAGDVDLGQEVADHVEADEI